MGIAVVSDEISQRLDMKARKIDFEVDKRRRISYSTGGTSEFT